MTTKLPRGIRLLAKYGESALKFKIIDGRYIGPLISKRKAADLRKYAMKWGTFGSFDPNSGGWDPAWDTPRKLFILKPPKLHLRERDRPDRAQKITVAMKGMPDRIAKYRQEINDRKPKKDVFFEFKRAERLAKLNRYPIPKKIMKPLVKGVKKVAAKKDAKGASKGGKVKK